MTFEEFEKGRIADQRFFICKVDLIYNIKILLNFQLKFND